MAEQPRLMALRDMAMTYKWTIDPDNENIRLDEEMLTQAVNEYYDQLPGWKTHLDCPAGIDHFKTAALTAHYLLKYPCLLPADPETTTVVYRHANTVFALEVALSRLVDGARPLLIGMAMKGRILGLFAEHAASVRRHLQASPDVQHDLAHTFLRVLSLILDDVERAHHALNNLPS